MSYNWNFKGILILILLYAIKVPLAKLNRNNKTITFLLCLLLLGIISNTLFVFPVIDDWDLTTSIGMITGIYFLIHLMILSFFIISTMLNPGYLFQHKGYDFQEILNKLDPIYICPDWKVIRTPRSRHWNLWDRCVERYDHHCPYINNWVGYRNHLYFVLFLFFIWCLLIYQIVIIWIAYNKDISSNWWEFFDDLNTEALFISVTSFILLIDIVFLFLVSLLLFTHLLNFFKNQTTHERFSGNRNENEESLIASNSNTNKSSSFIGSIMKSDLLVHDDAEIFELSPHTPRLRTRNESYVEMINKEGVVDGNYIAEMEYAKPTKQSKHKWGWRNIWRMVRYKPPSQMQAKLIVEKIMRKDQKNL